MQLDLGSGLDLLRLCHSVGVAHALGQGVGRECRHGMVSGWEPRKISRKLGAATFPDPAKIRTSHVQGKDLTLRMPMRLFKPITPA